MNILDYSTKTMQDEEATFKKALRLIRALPCAGIGCDPSHENGFAVVYAIVEEKGKKYDRVTIISDNESVFSYDRLISGRCWTHTLYRLATGIRKGNFKEEEGDRENERQIYASYERNFIEFLSRTDV